MHHCRKLLIDAYVIDGGLTAEPVLKSGSMWHGCLRGALFGCLEFSLPLCGAWGWGAGGVAATPRAATLAALPNLTPDFREGREDSEELLAAPRY